jgi:hypothetical protein
VARREKYRSIKDFFLRFWSKEFLVFLFFLTVSTSFWFLTTLNDTYETDIIVELRLEKVPERVVITENLPETFKMTVRDKGFNLLRYITISPIQPLRLQFSHYAGKGGHGGITSADVLKMMKQHVSESTKIVAVKAEHWDFYYTYGEHRKLPVLIGGQIKAKSDYYVMRTSIYPDSVTVYASEEAFDTITAIYTEPFVLDGLTESVKMSQRLQHVYGTKFSKSDTVSVSIFVDRLTEITVSVPVKMVNWPDNIQIKTFPAMVGVRVSVGVSNLSLVKPDLFSVVVDYKDMPKDSHKRFPLRLTAQPKGIIKAYLKTTEIDYIIEHLK